MDFYDKNKEKSLISNKVKKEGKIFQICSTGTVHVCRCSELQMYVLFFLIVIQKHYNVLQPTGYLLYM